MNTQYLVCTIALMIPLLSFTLYSSDVCTYSFDNFDTWFKKNKKFFERNDTDVYREPQNTPGTLTTAGMRYLMLNFPREIQHEIVKHLIPSLSPFIIGIQEDEINKTEHRYHNYKSNLRIRYKDNYNKVIIKCDCHSQAEQTYDVSGWFNTFVTEKSKDSKFRALWDTITRITHVRESTSIDPEFFILNPNTLCIDTVYTYKSQITWQVPRITKNHTYYCADNKQQQALNLYKVFMLLDQENQCRSITTSSLPELSKKTQILISRLKKNIEQTTKSTTIIKPSYHKKRSKKTKP